MMPACRVPVAAALLVTSCLVPAAAGDGGDAGAAGTLTILSVDASTLPGARLPTAETKAPAWRTSFGSERRSEPELVKPETAVEADIVLLQGVEDIRALRQWFPAQQWRLVVSRQMFGAGEPEPEVARGALPPVGDGARPAPVPTTAVAVRYRRGLRVIGQTHLLELADALGEGPSRPTAAGTAVRVLIDGRETWAVSILLPRECVASGGPDCPGRSALAAWHTAREAEGVRRVTGGRFVSSPAAASPCAHFGLRLDPPPASPKDQYTVAEPSPDLGCNAAVTVRK